MGLSARDDLELPPAARLEGVTLDSGWIIGERVSRLDGQTGGMFSVGYRTSHTSTSATAFLKALDFSRALQEENQLEAIEKSVNAFRFEQDLLSLCAERKMSKVVRALDSGYIKIDGTPLGRVPYLLFEPADGDIRKAISGFECIRLSWVLTILHQVALGLEQLHYAQIAHQDLKPSNVLAFEGGAFKVADLGCASRKDGGGPRDSLPVAGGLSVAPPEMLYGEKNPDWVVSRVACDLYSLGSLMVFLLAGASMNAVVRGYIPEDKQFISWRGTYREVLPFVIDAYAQALDDIQASLDPDWADSLMPIIRQLCEPDPHRRGDPRARGRSQDQYDVRKYVSRFGMLKRRAEYDLKAVVMR